VAGLPYLFETAGSTLAQYDSLDSYGIPFDYFATYAQRLQTVTAAAVQAVAVQHLAPEVLKVLVVGDGPSVLPKLRTLAATRPELMGGEVIVLDSEGRPTASP
jgi:zinc protease